MPRVGAPVLLGILFAVLLAPSEATISSSCKLINLTYADVYKYGNWIPQGVYRKSTYKYNGRNLWYDRFGNIMYYGDGSGYATGWQVSYGQISPVGCDKASGLGWGYKSSSTYGPPTSAKVRQYNYRGCPRSYSTRTWTAKCVTFDDTDYDDPDACPLPSGIKCPIPMETCIAFDTSWSLDGHEMGKQMCLAHQISRLSASPGAGSAVSIVEFASTVLTVQGWTDQGNAIWFTGNMQPFRVPEGTVSTSYGSCMEATTSSSKRIGRCQTSSSCSGGTKRGLCTSSRYYCCLNRRNGYHRFSVGTSTALADGVYQCAKLHQSRSNKTIPRRTIVISDGDTNTGKYTTYSSGDRVPNYSLLRTEFRKVPNHKMVIAGQLSQTSSTTASRQRTEYSNWIRYVGGSYYTAKDFNEFRSGSFVSKVFTGQCPVPPVQDCDYLKVNFTMSSSTTRIVSGEWIGYYKKSGLKVKSRDVWHDNIGTVLYSDGSRWIFAEKTASVPCDGDSLYWAPSTATNPVSLNGNTFYDIRSSSTCTRKYGGRKFTFQCVDSNPHDMGKNCPTPSPDPCATEMDICIAWDTSGSIDGMEMFEQVCTIKQLATRLAPGSAHPVTKKKSRVSIVQFGSKGAVDQDWTYNGLSIFSSGASMQQYRPGNPPSKTGTGVERWSTGGSTNIGAGMNECYKLLLKKRSTAKPVVLVLTDGAHSGSPSPSTLATTMKKKWSNLDIVVAAVKDGPFYSSQQRSYLTFTTADKINFVEDFKSYHSLNFLKVVTEDVCKVPSPPPPPPPVNCEWGPWSGWSACMNPTAPGGSRAIQFPPKPTEVKCSRTGSTSTPRSARIVEYLQLRPLEEVRGCEAGWRYMRYTSSSGASKTLTTTSASECESRCFADEYCKEFTFRPRATYDWIGTGTCEFFNQDPAPRKVRSSLYCSGDRTHKDVAGGLVDSLSECSSSRTATASLVTTDLKRLCGKSNLADVKPKPGDICNTSGVPYVWAEVQRPDDDCKPGCYRDWFAFAFFVPGKSGTTQKVNMWGMYDDWLWVWVDGVKQYDVSRSIFRYPRALGTKTYTAGWHQGLAVIANQAADCYFQLGFYSCTEVHWSTFVPPNTVVGTGDLSDELPGVSMDNTLVLDAGKSAAFRLRYERWSGDYQQAIFVSGDGSSSNTDMKLWRYGTTLRVIQYLTSSSSTYMSCSVTDPGENRAVEVGYQRIVSAGTTRMMLILNGKTVCDRVYKGTPKVIKYPETHVGVHPSGTAVGTFHGLIDALYVWKGVPSCETLRACRPGVDKGRDKRATTKPTCAWDFEKISSRNIVGSPSSCGSFVADSVFLANRALPCPSTDGSGTRWKTRTVATNFAYGGKPCSGAYKTSASCSDGVPACPIDCEVSLWGPWTRCSNTCGSGTQKRSRKVTQSAANGGAKCPGLAESRSCKDTSTCSPVCSATSWVAGKCSKSCGEGATKTSTRKVTCTKYCNPPNGIGSKEKCGMPETKKDPCPMVNCPINCKTSAWSSWSHCSAECGPGIQTRNRRITQKPQYGGTKCPTSLTQSKSCQIKECVPNCKMGAWVSSGKCSKACDDGSGPGLLTQTRTMSVQSPFTAADCPPKTQQIPCNTQPCPVDCEVSRWKNGKCSKDCGGGKMTQTRTITTKPANGGKACPALQQTANCNTKPCAAKCETSAWTNSGKCSKPCDDGSGPGKQVQTRTVECEWCAPNGKDVGTFCGPSKRTINCNTDRCPIDCVVGAWGAWGTCSEDCGTGKTTRTRKLTQPKFGGKVCPKTSRQTDDCFVKACPAECEYTPFSPDGECTKTCGTGVQNFTRRVTLKGLTSMSACGSQTWMTNFLRLEPAIPVVGSTSTSCPTYNHATESTKDIYKTAFGVAETTLDPMPYDNVSAGSKHYEWMPVVSGNPSSNAQAAKLDAACGYFYQAARIFSPAAADQTATGMVSFWQAVEVFLNGKQILSVGPGGQTQMDLSLTLKSGWNMLLLKVYVGPDTDGKVAVALQNCEEVLSFADHQMDATKCGHSREERSCNTDPCPVDCEMSEWKNKGNCSKPCGGGLQVQQRTIVTQPVGAGQACPAQRTQEVPCNTDRCPISCTYEKWVSGGCSKTCGGGVEKFTRGVTCHGCHNQSEVTSNCGDTTKEDPCNTNACPIDCVVSDWVEGDCSEPCGFGTKTFTRKVTTAPKHGGDPCPDLTRTESCWDKACAPECVYSAWQQASTCSASCGGGNQTWQRTVSVTNAASGGNVSLCEGHTEEQRPCNTHACPVDCEVTEWKAEGPCSKDCGNGIQKYVRTIETQATNGGKECPALTKEEYCNTQLCPPECSYGPWQEGFCSATCGGGTRTDTRSVRCVGCNKTHTMEEVCESSTQIEECNPNPCPVDCKLSEWGDWGECDEPCGPGKKTRSKSIIEKEAHGGTPCPTTLSEESPCTDGPCPPSCSLTPWVAEGNCSEECGGGRQTWTRENKGSGSTAECGHLKEERLCNTDPCPVNCVVTNWTMQGSCSAECGGGVQAYTRSIEVQPVGTGAACPKEMYKTEPCNEDRCDPTCKYGDFADAGPCSVSCGGGTRVQVRSASCQGCFNQSEVQAFCPDTNRNVTCNDDPCPVDCEVSAWGSWGDCSEPCGPGKKDRTRTVTTEAANGGVECPALTDEADCITTWCPPSCIFGPWVPTGACTKTCGGGEQTYTRTVRVNNTDATNVSAASCGKTTETRVCNADACPVECAVSDWEVSGKCTKDCGGGVQKMTRKITTQPTGGNTCPDLEQEIPCNTQKCDPICDVGKWENAGKCTVTCGGGTQAQTRKITCQGCDVGTTTTVCGPDTRSIRCNEDPCPVDCSLSPWTTWSVCTASCGEGTQQRSTSIQRQAVNGGKPCPELLTETRECSEDPCPIECTYSSWRATTNCSAECGGGKQSFQRNVSVHDAGAMYSCAEPEVHAMAEWLEVSPQKEEPCQFLWGQEENADVLARLSSATTPSWSDFSSLSPEVGQDVAQAEGIKWKSVKSTSPTNDFNAGCAYHIRVAQVYTPTTVTMTVKSRNVGAFWLLINGVKTIATETSQPPVTLPPETLNETTVTFNAGWNSVLIKSRSTGSAGSVYLALTGCVNDNSTRVKIMTERVDDLPSGYRKPLFAEECPGDLTEERPCNDQVCPTDCEVSAWENTGNCSRPCGGGLQVQTRTITKEAVGAGKVCPDLSQSIPCNEQPCVPVCHNGTWTPVTPCTSGCGGGTMVYTRTLTCDYCNSTSEITRICGERTKTEVCNTQPCPQNCTVSDWTAWGDCVAPCGTGTQTRTRTVVSPAENGGNACPSLTNVRECTKDPCPAICHYGAWTPSGVCSKTCGGGTQTFLRTKNSTDPRCTALSEDRPCNTEVCPVDCVVTPWKTESECTAACGGGVQKQVRNVTVQPEGAGKPCPAMTQFVECNTDPCPPECHYGEWLVATACSKTCGGGTQKQHRTVTCSNCAAGTLATSCPDTDRTVTCNADLCPTACLLSEWGPWGDCSQPCGDGSARRQRTVLRNASNGGDACPSSLEEVGPCNAGPCPAQCEYTTWSSSSKCVDASGLEVTCGGGKQTFWRNKTNTAPGGSPAECTGATEEVRDCATQQCPRNCRQGEWVNASECTRDCGGGQQKQTRETLEQPAYGGQECGPSVQYVNCNTQACAPQCTYGQWTDATTCTKTCGGGHKNQSRSVECHGCLNATHLADSCASPIQTVECNTQPCPVDCVVGPWEQGNCSASCGEGIVYATRGVVTPPANGGKTCPALSKTLECNLQPCPPECVYSPFQQNGKCTKECGGGVATYSRQLLKGTTDHCKAPLQEERPCNTQACSVNCEVSNWTSTSPCSVQCGGGTQEFVRTVTVQPEGLGSPCPSLTKTLECNADPCPPTCKYGDWVATTSCTKSCGGGIQTESRPVECQGCTSGAQLASACPDTTRSVSCNTNACPIDCTMSAWSDWTTCSEECGPGIQERKRQVLQLPQNNGKPCEEMEESRSCLVRECPPDCSYTAWKAVSSCSLTCASPECRDKMNCPGTQQYLRNLTLITEPWGNGTMVRTPSATPTLGCPGKLSEERPCNTDPCPVDCKVGEWADSGVCSVECGNGTVTQKRPVTVQPAGTGKPCPELTQVVPCVRPTCPAECTIGDWVDVTTCTKTCGGGTRNQSRAISCKGCKDQAEVLTECGPRERTVACNAQDCPQDCEVSVWNAWTSCSSMCGTGSQTRQRTVDTMPGAGGQACPPLSETRECVGQDCPPNCTVSAWVKSDACSKSCGGGTVTWSRVVDAVPPTQASECGSATSELRPCNTQPCPVDCVVSDWEASDVCDKSCGGGSQHFSRTIVTSPVGAGLACPALTKVDACNTDACPPKCSVGDWFRVGDCSKTCGGGVITEKRNIECVGCANATQKATTCGEDTREEPCNAAPCPVDCVVSPWSAWGACSEPCGPGTQKRKRAVLTDAQYGGEACPALEQSQDCDVTPCAPDCMFTAWGPAAVCNATCGENGTQPYTRTLLPPAKLQDCPASTSEERPCNRVPCAIDCVMSEWSNVGTCTASCGNGTQRQERTIVVSPAHGGLVCPAETSRLVPCTAAPCEPKCEVGQWLDVATCTKQCGSGEIEQQRRVLCTQGCDGVDPSTVCGPTKQKVACNTQPCDVDCVVSPIVWGECSEPCGDGGIQRGTRNVSAIPSGAGAPCPALSTTRPCDPAPSACESFCEYGTWTKAGECSKSCGGGEVLWTRSLGVPAGHDKSQCKGHTSEYRPCNEQPCDVDCVVSEWTEQSPCDKTCGSGVSVYTRKVTQLPQGNGGACPPLRKEDECNVQPCAPDCKYGAWIDTTPCTMTCGGGTKTEARSVTCSNCDAGKVTAQCGGAERTVVCNDQACPTDCQVSEWYQWSACDSGCGNGTQTRSRSILTEPKDGGAPCPDLTERKECSSDPCPANCQYGSWIATTPCTARCGGGTMTQARQVTARDGDLTACTEPKERIVACNEVPCPVDCEVSAWESGPCSAKCGGGTLTMTRRVTTQPVGTGTPCPALTQTSPCNTAPCAPTCEYSPWAEVGPCNATCNGGVQEYRRGITCHGCTNQTKDAIEAACGSVTKSLPCNTQKCPQDCVMSPWTWATCSEPCVATAAATDAVQVGTRYVITPAANGGQPCGVLSTTRPCDPTPPACPGDCEISPWAAAGACTVPCGGGTVTYRRSVTRGGQEDPTCGHDEEARPCNTQPCAVDCAMSEWTPLGPCTATCGDGEQHYVRTVTRQVSGTGVPCGPTTKTTKCTKGPCDPQCTLGQWQNVGTCSKTCGTGTVEQRRSVQCVGCTAGTEQEACGSATQTVPCNTQPCPINCSLTAWTAWSACDGCGTQGGQQSRTRRVLTPASNGGDACGPLSENRVCDGAACVPECQISAWVPAGACSADCGDSGEQTWTRTITVPNATGTDPATCGASSEVRPCNRFPCPVDCKLGEWKLGTCDKTCGGGTRTDTRAVLQEPSGSGVQCGPKTRESECNTQACDPQCDVGSWTDSEACTKECGGGTKVQRRPVTCKGCPAGSSAETVCGSAQRTVPCNEKVCDVDCEVSDWSAWSACSEPCGSGTQSATRMILTQATGAGKPCPSLKKSRECPNPATCPDDCVFGAWQAQGSCSKECGGGEQRFSRTVSLRPGSTKALSQCGSSMEVRPCNEQPCAVDCVLSAWTMSAPCNVSCGVGIERHERSIVTPPQGTGQACGDVVAEQPCRKAPCLPTCDLGPWVRSGSCDPCTGGNVTETRTVTCAFANGSSCDDATRELDCGAATRFVPCSTDSCKRDCEMGPWSVWTDCQATCGAGQKTRERVILRQPQNGGAVCPSTVDSQECTAPTTCPNDCWEGDGWDNITVCSADCGGGLITQQRRGTPPVGKDPCGASVRQVPCNTAPCPAAACTYSDWSSGSCSKDCGDGSREETRSILTGAAADCTNTSRTVPCNLGACPEVCVFTPWVASTMCPTGVCGGTQQESRTCSGCADCASQPTARVVPCTSAASCGKDCQLAEWGPWTPCSQPCGEGAYRERRRSILQMPTGDGQSCSAVDVETAADQKGSLFQFKACVAADGWNATCPAECNVGAWSPAPTTNCSAECGGGYGHGVLGMTPQSSTSSFDPLSCGDAVRQYPCNVDKCPIPCTVSEWEKDGECSATCGAGTQTYKRTLIYKGDPEDANPECANLTYTAPCEVRVCEAKCSPSAWSWMPKEGANCSVACGGGELDEVPDVTCTFEDGRPCDIGTHCTGGKLERTVPCNTDACPPAACELTPWSTWSECTAQCGTGSQQRTRTKVSGDCAANTLYHETRECNTQPCPVDCAWGEWSSIGAASCSARCGAGLRTQTREVIIQAAHGGTPCTGGATLQTECIGDDCEACDSFTVWMPVAPCTQECTKPCPPGASGPTADCGPGMQTFTRDVLCTYEGKDCNASMKAYLCGPLERTNKCNDDPCPQDCVVSEWGDWGECGAETLATGVQPCGSSSQKRKRTVLTAAVAGGAACPHLEASRPCDAPACPAGCVAGPWEQSQPCSKECGGGESLWTREVLPPNDPKCAGVARTEERACNEQVCSRDCIMGDWTEWSNCSVSCLSGTSDMAVQTSRREIIQQATGDGRPCGPHTQTRPCDPMPAACPCEYTDWFPISNCSRPCDVGEQHFARNITKGDPNVCYEGRMATEECNMQECPSDCVMDVWTEWSPCSETCTAGITTRRRTVLRPAVSTGQPCEGAVFEYTTCRPSVNCTYNGQRFPCDYQSEWTPAPGSECQGETGQTCGWGTRKHVRTLAPGSDPACEKVSHDEMDDFPCFLGACDSSAGCAEPGPWSEWAPMDDGSCSVECGFPTQKRVRTSFDMCYETSEEQIIPSCTANDVCSDIPPVPIAPGAPEAPASVFPPYEAGETPTVAVGSPLWWAIGAGGSPTPTGGAVAGGAGVPVWLLALAGLAGSLLFFIPIAALVAWRRRGKPNIDLMRREELLDWTAAGRGEGEYKLDKGAFSGIEMTGGDD
eukprot:TRINITY_DN3164_c0_g1_i1.p1 TRINITY_DN3164_c0_g1~~TRINITY_DN3164_c0_g1_i1.p1  ORF type:complete len:6949 (+),score=1286.42 TRINITY_DN3164_c0_g1_i1:147-20993(+)